jgi:hypothetical protein
MCHTINAIVGNLFFFLHHQNKAHLQFSTSIGYQHIQQILMKPNPFMYIHLLL